MIIILKKYNNKYISIKDINEIKKDNIADYKKIKYKIFKTKKERSFVKKYKSIDKLVLIHNNEYINNKREEIKLLNNINGYPLDEYQSKVVLSDEEASLVIAGAGSGKSLTIIAKIIYLIKECHVNKDDILCISFTNDAVNNLKNSIKKNYNLDLNIYTFHKLSLKIIKDQGIIYDIADDNLLNDIIDKYLNNIKENNYYKELNKLNKNNLKKLISTFINLFKANNYEVTHFKTILHKIGNTINYKKYMQNKKIILLIINIYNEYEKNLKEESLLDFNDMINVASSIVKNGLNDKWKYIIVDEYQDTSYSKFILLKEIIKITNAKLLVVGDDFQSIYRFTGCDLNIFLRFTSLFDNAKIFSIINTYRNPQELINVAGSFIMKNKNQQRKLLISNKHLDKPIKIIYTNNKIKTLKDILQKDKDFFVIGRNNKDIYHYIDDEYKELDNGHFKYQDITFRYLTAHKSKGLESTNVILINVEDDILGFPTKIPNEELLKYVNNIRDYYPYEEERRLFYVALTRTKNNVYIITNKKSESIFVKELKQNKKHVDVIYE